MLQDIDISVERIQEEIPQANEGISAIKKTHITADNAGMVKCCSPRAH